MSSCTQRLASLRMRSVMPPTPLRVCNFEFLIDAKCRSLEEFAINLNEKVFIQKSPALAPFLQKINLLIEKQIRGTSCHWLELRQPHELLLLKERALAGLEALGPSIFHIRGALYIAPAVERRLDARRQRSAQRHQIRLIQSKQRLGLVGGNGRLLKTFRRTARRQSQQLPQ